MFTWKRNIFTNDTEDTILQFTFLRRSPFIYHSAIKNPYFWEKELLSFHITQKSSYFRVCWIGGLSEQFEERNRASETVHIVSNKEKGRISKWVLQVNKVRNIFWKTNISYPLILKGTCTLKRVRNVRFLGNFDVLCFLEPETENFHAAGGKSKTYWRPCSNIYDEAYFENIV